MGRFYLTVLAKIGRFAKLRKKFFAPLFFSRFLKLIIEVIDHFHRKIVADV